jgi:hypothetical protein
MNTAESTPRRRNLRSKAALFFPKTVPGRLAVLAVILSQASDATVSATIAPLLLASAFIVAVWDSLRGNGRRIVRLRRTLVRTVKTIIGLAAIGEIAGFLAFLTSGGNGSINFGRTDVFGSIAAYVVLAMFVVLVWVPQVFLTIQLDIKGTGDAQRVLLSLITATACGLTATYLVLLHISGGGPLRRIPPGPLVAAIIGIIVIVAPLYRALARVCWQRGLGGVFGLRTLQQRWRNTMTELGKALERDSQLAKKATQRQ